MLPVSVMLLVSVTLIFDVKRPVSVILLISISRTSGWRGGERRALERKPTLSLGRLRILKVLVELRIKKNLGWMGWRFLHFFDWLV